MIGVAASSASKGAILVAGVAGLVAGSMSMAVGEYVSVSSQRDAEQADIKLEKQELTGQPEAELHELAMIYVKRGLDKELAMKVAEQLSMRDRLGAHMLDELKIDQASLARPMQAAWISAASFASFAVVPITALLVAPAALRIPVIAALSLVSLAALGAFGGVSLRQACMNQFEGYGIVGCQLTLSWRTADEYQTETQISCSVGGASTAVRALAADASGTIADRRSVVDRGCENGRRLRNSPDRPCAADQLLCAQETDGAGICCRFRSA
jgi:VIT1/CCC1 family predicted Fe2+/Mn2+ transporter